MPAIQRRYHFGLVTLAPHKVDSKALCGQKVNVRTKDGELAPVFFAGFINQCDLAPGLWQRVKVDDVPFYSKGSTFFDEWIYYGPQTTMLGAMPIGLREVWLVLQDEYPIAWCEISNAPSLGQ